MTPRGRGMVAVGLASLLLPSASGPVWAAAPEAVQRFVLIVGHNEGGPGRPALRFAHDDAARMAEVLTQLGGVQAPHQRLLLDPDNEALSQALQDAAATLGEVEGRTEWIFYYSGHSDESGLLLGDERFEYTRLRGAIDALDADVRVAILDSCASGSLIRAKGGTAQPAFLVDTSSRVDGIAYITSSSEDEAAQEADRLEGSFFTHYFTVGLRGAADLSGDGRVTLHEAYKFAFDTTLAHTERTRYGPQHAAHDFHLSGTGDLVLTELERASATLLFADDIAGRAAVRRNGRLQAEIDKPPGRDLALALPVGLYTVTLTREGQHATAEVDLQRGSTGLLSATDLAWTRGERTAARGNGRPPLPWDDARFSLVPRPDDAQRRDHLVGHLGASRSGELDGLSIGVGMATVESGRGAMLDLGFNLARGPFEGFQGTFVANSAGELTGAQLAAGVNVAQHGLQGFQGAFGANVAHGEGWLGQLSAFANVSSGSFDGFQLALGVNVAQGLRGTQLALLNVGGRVHGAQIGLLNIGRYVQGTQIGLVNIARDVEGPPIGLLNISRNGRYDVSAFVTESDWINLDLKVGGQQGMYTMIGGGGDPGRDAYLLAGLGGHVRSGLVFFDLDSTIAAYRPTRELFGGPPVWVVGGRLIGGAYAREWLAPFAGFTYHYRIPSDEEATVGVDLPSPWSAPDTGPRRIVRGWPGFVVGVQF